MANARENSDRIKLLGARIINLKRFAESDTKDWSCFNPSIGFSPRKGYAISFRSSNYVILPHGELSVEGGGKIRNRIYFAEVEDDFKIKNFRKIEVPENILPTPRGIEDPRLFWRGRNWYFAGVMMEQHTPVARLCVCKLNLKCTEVETIEVYDGLKPNQPEKNWLVPDVKPNPNFDFIYGPTAVVKGDKIIYTMSDSEQVAPLRGNAHLIEQPDGTYITIMHKLWIKKSKGYSQNRFSMVEWVHKNYGHYFVRFDKFGSIIEMSEAFQFISPGIEFVGGMVEKDGNFVISFGKDDVSSHLAVYPKSHVVRMMKPLYY